ncbi:hypothetical protein IGB42_00171 [Andreprevotia sp. IGB-42]|uniref:hypothetical protein n=1 Tax=Andreprevotia sp. IGB-42 TaxID=2497473 RepID=UPI00135C75CA|nr:hypothetical protein [Andreprevotia sp. IGB-42]KAF0815094.1 hypothetical protein IGB42_00171 [Andreprevotia sp. IGB-42]
MDKASQQQRLIEPVNRLIHARRIGLRNVHRVNIPRQQPFDHETGQLYDPDNHKKAD